MTAADQNREHAAAGDCCRQRADMMWAQDEILLAGVDRRTIPTEAIDLLPPWRARMCVNVALRAGARMERGDLDQLRATARRVGGAAGPGWWRHELDVDAPLR